MASTSEAQAISWARKRMTTEASEGCNAGPAIMESLRHFPRKGAAASNTTRSLGPFNGPPMDPVASTRILVQMFSPLPNSNPFRNRVDAQSGEVDSSTGSSPYPDC
ncbi:hypothetical protein OUZ56_011581 [Daphnia magna]|uniref:Uncharacterized protein n=1 Tax=Daphnia magna TaxID=35525 RepID=A0ABQ9Z0M9_9CRUS|nr:hypothetical protein OUZ56_011581 [Daphnia magna]